MMHNDTYTLINSDCRTELKNIESQSIDAIITDPPYAEVDRSYGRFSEDEWHELMDAIMPEFQRILKPNGSAMILLQPNSEKCGRMRLWLWEFLVKWGHAWNLIQDAYCMNISTLPSGCSTVHGLMRPSVKYCCWFGSPNCYRNQNEILWAESETNRMGRLEMRAKDKTHLDKRIYYPCGQNVNKKKCYESAEKKGGVTPFNFFPSSNGISNRKVNGASTDIALARYWVRYICPPNGIVLDPFSGVGTIGRASLLENRKYLGIEKNKEFYETSIEELKNP